MYFLTIPLPPKSTRFPYTTLFRSGPEDLHIERSIGKEVEVDRRTVGRAQGDRGPPVENPVCRQAGEVVPQRELGDRKSTRLNSSHMSISYAVFCLKKKKQDIKINS